MKNNNLTKEEIKHIANLANLHFKDEEIQKFEGQLAAVLDYIEKLQKANTKNVSQTNQTTGLKNITRKDSPEKSLNQEEVTSNTSNKHNGYFRVKAVFG